MLDYLATDAHSPHWFMTNFLRSFPSHLLYSLFALSYRPKSNFLDFCSISAFVLVVHRSKYFLNPSTLFSWFCLHLCYPQLSRHTGIRHRFSSSPHNSDFLFKVFFIYVKLLPWRDFRIALFTFSDCIIIDILHLHHLLHLTCGKWTQILGYSALKKNG